MGAGAGPNSRINESEKYTVFSQSWSVLALVGSQHRQLTDVPALVHRPAELFDQGHQAPQRQVEALTRHRMQGMGGVADQGHPGRTGSSTVTSLSG